MAGLPLVQVPPAVASVKVIVDPTHTPAGPVIGETIGVVFIVMLTFVDEDAQGGFEIVQAKVYVVPALPVNVDVGLVGDVIVPPVPDTIVHNPVPTTGVFPASVALPQTD
jgi:hypothetical protein